MDSLSVCINCRLGWLSLSGLVFRPLLQPEGFSCALVGDYTVVTSQEVVQIRGHSGTALPQTSLCQHGLEKGKAKSTDPDSVATLKSPKNCRTAGHSSKCRLHARKQIVPCSSLCTKPDGLLRPCFQSKVVQNTKGRSTMEYESLHCCLSKLPWKQDSRILMLVPPQRDLYLMHPKPRLAFC